MKHKIVSLFLLLGISIFAIACSDDDDSTNISSEPDQVSISVALPNALNTLTQEMASHQLRCILEVWSKDVTPNLVYRKEVIAPDKQTQKFSLDFTIQDGTYNYLIWADYIDVDAVTEQKTFSGGIAFAHYTDKYYGTSNLRQITATDVKCFIDNEACDAFFYSGELLKKEKEARLLEVELIHPFTKISIRENDKTELTRLKGLSLSYNSPVKFDVSSGKVSKDRSQVTYTNNNYNSEVAIESTLFTAYIFTDSESHEMGAIDLTLITAQGSPTITIPEELITLERGRHIKVNGNMMKEVPDPDDIFEIVYDIDVDDWNSEDVDID